MTAVCIIHLPACPNAFPLFLKRNWIMGGLGQDSSIFFPLPRLLTNGNILILAFIPQDGKYNFMITSLLEPCLIIPNYAARHLVHSVSPTMQPEQQLARCSVCVQSPWYHQWACSPILAGYNAGTYAVVLIMQHGIVQEGVYFVSLAPASFLQFVTQFTQTWGVERFRPCAWRMQRRTGTTFTYWGRIQGGERRLDNPRLQVSNEKVVFLYASFLFLHGDLWAGNLKSWKKVASQKMRHIKAPVKPVQFGDVQILYHDLCFVLFSNWKVLPLLMTPC